MLYDTIIFDLDGTLLDTLTDLTDSLNYALAAHHQPVHTPEQVRQMLGNGLQALLRQALPADTPETLQQEIFQTLQQYYHVHHNDHTQPYTGIIDLLRHLRATGHRLAIVSNKPHQDAVALAEQHFHGLIDCTIGEQQPHIPRKPAPQMLLNTITRLNATRPVYVGDSEIDIQTANNANVPVVSVAWGFRSPDQLRASHAATIVESPEQLRAVL